MRIVIEKMNGQIYCYFDRQSARRVKRPQPIQQLELSDVLSELPDNSSFAVPLSGPNKLGGVTAEMLRTVFATLSHEQASELADNHSPILSAQTTDDYTREEAETFFDEAVTNVMLDLAGA